MFPCLWLWSGLALAMPADECPTNTAAGVSDLGLSSFRSDGKLTGAGVDVLQELALRTGCPFTIGWYPRGRLLAELAAGRLDVTPSAARTPERDRDAQFVPYVFTQFELLLTGPGATSYASLADFVNRSKARLNIVRGLYFTPDVLVQLERLRRANRLEEVADFETLFRKLEHGRAEGTMASPLIYLRYFKPEERGRRFSAIAVPESAPTLVGIYLSRKSLPDSTRQQFSLALRSMVEDGTVQRIYAKYVDASTLKLLFPGGTKGVLANYPPTPQPALR
jgi:polar amino acid transport system substrate-binding protein